MTETIERDQGCDLAPYCLKCPLPRCRYDLKWSGDRRSRAARNRRDREILRQRTAAGRGVAELATEFDLSKRTIQRIISTAKGRGCSCQSH